MNRAINWREEPPNPIKEGMKMSAAQAAQVLPFEAPKPKPSFGAMLGATKKTEAAPK
jgi:hypothetical protein